MTIQEIKDLIQVFNESNVAEMEVQRGENRLRLRRASAAQEIEVQETVVPVAAPAHSTSAAHEQSHMAPAQTAGPQPHHPPGEVTSRGTLYLAASPGAPP